MTTSPAVKAPEVEGFHASFSTRYLCSISLGPCRSLSVGIPNSLRAQAHGTCSTGCSPNSKPMASTRFRCLTAKTPYQFLFVLGPARRTGLAEPRPGRDVLNNFRDVQEPGVPGISCSKSPAPSRARPLAHRRLTLSRRLQRHESRRHWRRESRRAGAGASRRFRQRDSAASS